MIEYLDAIAISRGEYLGMMLLFLVIYFLATWYFYHFSEKITAERKARQDKKDKQRAINQAVNKV
jgi:hypothetical protein